eukprot:gene9424-12698_t
MDIILSGGVNPAITDNNVENQVETQPLLPSIIASTDEVKHQWYHYWDVKKNLSQVFVRERNPDLFAIDAFRAMGFLWIINSHLQEGLATYFLNFEEWIEENISKAMVDSSAQGVTVFFVISGFLNIMVTESITKKNKEPNLSLRGASTYLFRRCCHLPPNLYVIVVIALLYGCNSNYSDSITTFCTPCLNSWWTDFIFLTNFSEYIASGGACFNSTWSVSAQMQLYITSIPVFYAYSVKKSYGYWACAAFTIIPLILRVVIIEYYLTNYIYQIYLPFYTRADAYGLGMVLYMLYNDYLKGRSVSKEFSDVYNRVVTATYRQLVFSSLLWIIAILSIYLGMVNIFKDDVPDWIISVFSTKTAEDQYESYSLFIVSMCAISLAYVALEGTLWPVSWFFQLYVWYPIASLSYTGYLFSLMVSYQYASFLYKINDGEKEIWNGSIWDFVWIYFQVLVTILLFALALSLIVEKPFLNIARVTNF